MEYCSKCGAILEPGRKFCKNCGTSVGGYADSESVGVEQTWKPTIAGALTISAGAIGLVFGLVFVTRPPLFVVGLPTIIISIVAVAGGICAAARKAWGLALAGSICAVPLWLGIPAIVFVVLSRQEFSQ
jgi:hypothetical protein